MQFFVKKTGGRKISIIPYVGNKAGFSHIFDNLILDKFANKEFFDLFGGGSSFTLYLCKRFGSKNVAYNEKNPVLVNFLKVVQSEPKSLIREYKKHQRKSNFNYYAEIRDSNIEDGVVAAGRFFYLAKNCFSGKVRFNKNGKFNCPMRKDKVCRGINEDQIHYISSLIKKLRIYNKSYEEFEDIKNSFVYLDPPYLNNPNWHYSGLIDSKGFIQFIKKIETSNKIMISEQNPPKVLKLSSQYEIHKIAISGSLQYFTNSKLEEIIATNYRIPVPHAEKLEIPLAVSKIKKNF